MVFRYLLISWWLTLQHKMWWMTFQRQCDETTARDERVALLQLAFECISPDNHSEKHDLYVDLWLCRIRQNMEQQVRQNFAVIRHVLFVFRVMYVKPLLQWWSCIRQGWLSLPRFMQTKRTFGRIIIIYIFAYCHNLFVLEFDNLSLMKCEAIVLLVKPMKLGFVKLVKSSKTNVCWFKICYSWS